MRSSLLRKFSSIKLTEQESAVFTSLLEASDAMGKGTVLRAAGGWVRDKLLGNDSCDIDIALDNVPGDEFAQFLHERERSRGNISSIGVVKENPLQSKHIRTASFRFHGLDLDINNLRSETYAEHSRIPEVEFAKHPSDDALRRDFTINALYYNLNTKEIEDFTGTGLADLDARVIRTPLPASKTFVDDPLRVLRAIRFAARFKFDLDQSIKLAWGDSDVREGLTNKVSRERVGVEITKMMKHPTAKEAIRLLHDAGLILLILTPPTDSAALSLAGVNNRDYQEWLHSSIPVEIASSSVELETPLSIHEMIPCTQKYILHFACLLFDSLRLCPNPALIVRLALKVSAAESKAISLIITQVEPLREIVHKFANSELSESDCALQIGRLTKNTLKEFILPTFVLTASTEPSLTNEATEALYEKTLSVCKQYDLLTCYEWKPVMDGAEIQRVFALKPGKVIQELLSVEFDLMFLKERSYDVIHDHLKKHLEASKEA